MLRLSRFRIYAKSPAMLSPDPETGLCNCCPTEGYHQYHCETSRHMRRVLRERGKPPEPIDPTQRAKV
jgi:hypothetical protein